MQSIVAIDIESTGLSEERDAIIEIGAVKFKGHRVEAEWSSLINPGRHIPEFISGLTGISDVEVRSAPSYRSIAQDLQAFVGDAPVVGHNVHFDLGFLQKAGILQYNEVIDTYEMASVLMPTASRYNLGSLGKQLGILLPATHRALDDARVTMAAFNRLFEMARELPLELLADIVRLSEPLEWDAGWLFQEVLQAKAKEGVQSKRVKKKDVGTWFDDSKFPPLLNPENPVPLDVDEIASVLEYGGPFSQYFQSFEQRPEQVDMLRAVSNALSYGSHLMVEAGTGVGKSFAYLVPAALFAKQNNTRVVVSTNTINLQDQLIQRDLPNLSQALNLDFRFSVLKGRSNYLCPRRLENLRHFGPRNADEMRVLAKVMVWQLNNQSGDRSELNLTGPTEREVWVRLSAEDDACTTETCIKRTGGACPFHRAKTMSQAAHVLVVNHALLLSDVATGSKVLPEYSHLIIDEGHHLESATTNALSFKLNQFDMERMMKEIGGTNTGVLGRLLGEMKDALRPSDFGLLQKSVSRATDMTFRIEQMNRQFYTILGEFAKLQREGQPQSNYSWQARVLPSTRTLPGWDEVEIAWDTIDETLSLLISSLAEIYKAAADLYADGHENLQDVMADMSNVARRLTEAEANINGMIGKPVQGMVYWIEVQPNGNRLSLNAAPLSVGPLVEKYLWHEKRCLILTSATLTTHGEFQYLRNTLGADEADEMQLGSPYDYESAALLYIANDIPEPNAHGYQQALDRTILATAKATGGRMLVLFTSYAALKKTAQAITGPLAREEIYVYEQGDGASPNALLESFKATERAVLLGTRSFWEGVDVPGDSLSVVVLTKLPFDVPTDPLIAARSEIYEDSFNQYYLPEAILKFRQGFGRLIRTASDRGVVAILDRRVLTKQYGRLFLESLPPCTARQGPVTNLAREAGKWLGCEQHMGRIEKTVFISYRRTNTPWALAIYQHLTSQGYDVFFDYLSIPSGDFEKIIIENIKGRAHFIVILTPSALERCHEPKDWLRREIETAMDEKRNIVPLMLESFDYGSPATINALTGKLESLKKYNSLRIPSEYFFEAMARLREQFLSVALGDVAQPISDNTKQIAEEHQAAASEAKQVEQKELSAQEWFERGYVFAQDNNYDEAIRCYTEAIRLKPDFMEAYGNRALALNGKGDIAGELRDYNNVIRLNPKDYLVYYNRGITRIANNNLKGALADYDEAIRLKPDYAEAHSNRGVARRANNDLKGALSDFDEAIRLKPDYAEAHINRGVARRANNDLKGALSDFDEAIRLKPDYAEAYINRGLIHQLTGNLNNAVKDYEEANRLKPNNGTTRSSLMSVLRKLGRNIEADAQEDLARSLIEEETEYNQACFEAICGNTDKALELLKIGLDKKQSTKEWARQDPDFEGIRDDLRFKELVGE